MRERAITALHQPGLRNAESDNNRGQRTRLPTARSETDGVDELLILLGITRIVEHRNANCHSGSDSPSRVAVCNADNCAETPGSPSSRAWSFPPDNISPANLNQQHTTFGRNENAAPRRVFSRSAEPCIHQTDQRAWSEEVDGLFESLHPFQQLNPFASHYGRQAEGDTHGWDDYLAHPVVDIASEYAGASNSLPTGDSNASASTIDNLSDETVSTGQWRQFMQQSGLSSATPLHFAFDTPANSAAPDWHPASRPA